MAIGHWLSVIIVGGLENMGTEVIGHLGSSKCRNTPTVTHAKSPMEHTIARAAKVMDEWSLCVGGIASGTTFAGKGASIILYDARDIHHEDQVHKGLQVVQTGRMDAPHQVHTEVEGNSRQAPQHTGRSEPAKAAKTNQGRNAQGPLEKEVCPAQELSKRFMLNNLP